MVLKTGFENNLIQKLWIQTIWTSGGTDFRKTPDKAIGNDGIWEKLDMPSRSALHRYSRLRIYGTAKDRDEERTLLNEIACGLGDLALVRKNGIALEKMCNGNGLST